MSNGLDTLTPACLTPSSNGVEDGTASGLVVYKLDRLARSLTVQEGTLAKVWGLEVPCSPSTSERWRGTTRTTRCGRPCAKWSGVFAELETWHDCSADAWWLKAQGGTRWLRGKALHRSGIGVEGGLLLVPDDAESRTLVRIAELRESGRIAQGNRGNAAQRGRSQAEALGPLAFGDSEGVCSPRQKGEGLVMLYGSREHIAERALGRCRGSRASPKLLSDSAVSKRQSGWRKKG